jgi:DNA-binding transcriptional ArsR family regulator
MRRVSYSARVAVTVSHHLGVLHDAGLVMRSRHRRLVLYRRSEQATRLLGESSTAS